MEVVAFDETNCTKQSKASWSNATGKYSVLSIASIDETCTADNGRPSIGLSWTKEVPQSLHEPVRPEPTSKTYQPTSSHNYNGS